MATKSLFNYEVEVAAGITKKLGDMKCSELNDAADYARAKAKQLFEKELRLWDAARLTPDGEAQSGWLDQKIEMLVRELKRPGETAEQTRERVRRVKG